MAIEHRGNMTITMIDPKFQTTDGLEFPSKEDAQIHQDLIDAKVSYETAFFRYTKKLSEIEKTADGKPFMFKTWETYWYLNDFSFHRVPLLEKIEIGMSNASLDFNESGKIYLVYRREPTQCRHYKIDELYVSEMEAKKALIKAREKFLVEFASETKKMKK